MAALAPARRLPRGAVPAALVLLALGTYGRALGHSFLLNWDDLTYVLENPLIERLDLEHLRRIFTEPWFGNFAPMHLLSYAVDRAIWGLEPAGFVATNLALHAASGVLVLLLLGRVGCSRAAAAFGAAIFLVHPVQVESVAWISERKNLLAMFFSLLSVHAFLAWRRTDGALGSWAYAGALAALAAALLSKAAAVAVPPLLWLLDAAVVPPERRRRPLLALVPFALVALGVALATLSAQREMIEEGRAAFAMDRATTLYTMVPVVIRYLGLVAWPANLSPIYTPAFRTAPDASFALGAALLVVVAVGAFLLRRRSPLAAALIAFFFVALGPVLQLVPLPTLMQDRYLYFPMLTVAGLAALAVDATRSRWGREAAVVACATAVLGGLATASLVRTGTWRDDETLFADATAKAPDSALAWVGLGVARADAGRPAEAVSAFQRALALDPAHHLAMNGLGAALNTLGQYEAARPYLLRASELPGDRFPAFMNLGVGWLATGDLAAAAAAFQAALEARPGAPEAIEMLSRARGER